MFPRGGRADLPVGSQRPQRHVQGPPAITSPPARPQPCSPSVLPPRNLGGSLACLYRQNTLKNKRKQSQIPVKTRLRVGCTQNIKVHRGKLEGFAFLKDAKLSLEDPSALATL